MVSQRKHLTHEGLEEIARIRELLNEGRGRRRKYTIDDIMADGDNGNPQRLHVERENRSR